MPSKLRKVIGAVKDQTSISIAKVSSNNSSNLDVAVLKATTHDEVPLDERYVNEVLLLTSSNKIMAAACAQAIAKRIGRTRNWIVALKTLMLVLRIFQDGDPYFPREVLHAMKRGAKILNLSSFRDDKNPSPWDYTAFIRTYALYLDERLNCFLLGKLQRRAVVRERESQRYNRTSTRKFNEHVRDMKPAMLLDKISYWQRLLDRALATRPTGVAKTNRLVQISLYAVVRESFDLYRDISDGLALLLDSFFHLQYQSCVDAYQTCIKASKQFQELCGFYTLCKSIGVGRISEYPSVQKISDELLETLQEFLKDQSSFPSGNGTRLLLPGPSNNEGNGLNSIQNEASEQSETSEQQQWLSSEERDSDMGSELYSHQRVYSSLEDLLSVTDAGTSPSISIITDHEQNFDQWDKQTQEEDNWNMEGSISPSISIEQRNSSALDLGLIFDDQTQVETSVSGCSPDMSRDGWELELAECASNISSTPALSYSNASRYEPSLLDDLYKPAPIEPQQNLSYSNPFLSSVNEHVSTAVTPTSPLAMSNAAVDPFSSPPTFQATPTFCAQNPNDTENDPFASSTPVAKDQFSDGSTMNRQNLLLEQQLWLQNQNKIIARHIA
ncbi:AP180 N-terminal homology (ANTH) domain [Macleaya cordata]|uniref:AP180 N-terminal homology (ANTH) domain n=1 Tax=Macleaya cordata TaxID=56857 RepID=A0A200RBD0_MACCD|nr:AP180 N-terminal homology (ANTH) domain [Macleaya cordata]